MRVKWINELVDGDGNFLPHLLPVDPTLHWANPGGGEEDRDTRPTFETTPGAYTGPVPIVTHVHGAVGVGDESDGYSEAWFLPKANDIPEGFATQGTWYEFFANKAAQKGFGSWEPGSATFQYPNNQRASTIWYHDHALGMTRLNVYAGPAGFFLIRGGPAGDSAVLDSRTHCPAVLPGPAPKAGDRFPANKTYYEIPIAVQDRSFNDDGSLFYPDSRDFFEDFPEGGPFIPGSDIAPIWNPEFFGNTIMVNGNTWPFQTVEKRRYRIRFLNGCNSRFLILDFNNIPGVEVWQIGNEGGFLAAPVNMTAVNGNRLLMSPAERADVIVDFSKVPLGNYVLGNVGPDEPFKGFNPDGTLTDGEGGSIPPADSATTGQVLEFRVIPARSRDYSTPPKFLKLPRLAGLPHPVRTRPLALLEMMTTTGIDAPAEAMLGIINPAGIAEHKMWADEISEDPAVGDTEIWEFHNFTADAHPMHIHELTFKVLNRQPITWDEGGEEDIMKISNIRTTGDARSPEAWENGWKDTVITYPGEVTRVIARFLTPGQYVWHCHIVEHEDNEMMRPYRIGPVQDGQPMGGM